MKENSFRLLPRSIISVQKGGYFFQLRMPSSELLNSLKVYNRSSLRYMFSHSIISPLTLSYLQRTWEDPTHVHPDTMGCRGDNDPLDVCEIGLRIVQPGVS